MQCLSQMYLNVFFWSERFKIGTQQARLPVHVHNPRDQGKQADLSAVRRTAGLSQVELSASQGVGQSYVSNVERGETYVNVMVFMDGCHVCQVPPDDMLGRRTQRWSSKFTRTSSATSQPFHCPHG